MFCSRNEHSVVGQLYFRSKLIEKEIRFVVTRGRGRGGWAVGRRNWMEGVKRYKLPVDDIRDVIQHDTA